MPPNKKSRVQAYLEPELAEIIRNRAAEEGRPESREVSRLVRLGLEVEGKFYRLGGKLFRTKADIKHYILQARSSAIPDLEITDPVVVALMSTDKHWQERVQKGYYLSVYSLPNGDASIDFAMILEGYYFYMLDWLPLIDNLIRI
mgnify:CR=1 FL=1